MERDNGDAAEEYMTLTTVSPSAGFYHSPGWNRDYPRVQILTVGDLLSGAGRVELPPAEFATFKQARKVKGEDEGEQGSLFG